MTRVEGIAAGIGTAALAIAERLACAVQLDGRQATHLRIVCGVLGQIVALGHAESAELARVALEHMLLAEEPDRYRDEHVGICLTVALGIRRAVAAIGRTIERATVGRARPEEE